jgi:hypothetical protein
LIKTFFEYGFVFGKIFHYEIGFFVVSRVNDTADLLYVVPLPRLTKKTDTTHQRWPYPTILHRSGTNLGKTVPDPTSIKHNPTMALLTSDKQGQ